MLKLLFPTYNKIDATSYAILLLRVAFAAMLMTHGWAKLSNFSQTAASFESMGGSVAAGLAVFAEFFCSMGVIVGFLHRLAIIPMIITMSVAFFIAHGGKLVGEGSGEMAFLYLIAFISLLITGAGRFSVDHIIGTRLQNRN